MPTSRRLLGVQYLRAVAAVMVVYYHIAVQIPAYAPFLEFRSGFDSRNFGAGVDIFFVISGFIMMATTQRIPPGDFLARRLIRIVPLYWLLTSAVVALSFLDYFKQTLVTPALVAKSLFFVPYVAPSGRIEPVLVPGWTLNVEMFFYVSFAAALFISRRRRMLIVSMLFIGLVLGGRVLTDPAQNPIVWLLTRNWMLEFCTGMLIGHLYLQRIVSLPTWICSVLILGGFGSLMSSWLPRNMPGPYVLSATCIVLGVVGYELRTGFRLRRVAALLGDASYSIYLSHLFALGFVTMLWKRSGFTVPDGLHAAVFAIVSMAAALLGALLLYRCVEKPMLNTLNTKLRLAPPERARITSESVSNS